MDFNKDYYNVLGVENNATREQIKAAYRSLVKKFHPDRNQDNKDAAEKMKEINEAHEVLDSDISRFVYDEYKRNEEKNYSHNEKAPNQHNNDAPKPPNKKTYFKTKVLRKERRIYVKGSIIIKFWAEQETDLENTIMKEMSYRLNPVSAEALITSSDIHDFIAPVSFQKSYTNTELFKTSVPLPVKSKIVSPTGKDEYYDLSLQDIRIIDPKLIDIVKHEKQSLGTLTGEFYAYVLRIDEEEIIEEVTECSGETGRTESKTAEDTEFIRHEYYNKDCTTFWGPWIAIKKRQASQFKTKYNTVAKAKAVTTEGCAGFLWIPLVVLFIFVWPELFAWLLVLLLIGILISAGASIIARLLPFLGLLLLVSFLYAAFSSGAKKNATVKRDFKPSYDTLKSSIVPVTRDSINTGSFPAQQDSLIEHFITWKDYDSNSYSITLSVLTSDLRKSTEDHNSYSQSGYLNSLSPVYRYFDQADQPRLSRIYKAFDSIRSANNMSNLSFAKTVVSCIQSIPYYLVVDQSCSADYSNDEFIQNYLRQCNGECCIGYSKYGVRTPTEFMSDLKGDCDTRSLLIYSILKKFNINVALLTSQYYKHAIIAINILDDQLEGLSMNINNKNFYLWETTSFGFQPGQIPDENQNLAHWDISLLNEKN